mmetsp:Transcript_28881/g.68445  ORF Transcript_28881/g.68445 Transcript_28881/m.68445 type:complete len:243 (+) Transcript_28881:616-1344(+)
MGGLDFRYPGGESGLHPGEQRLAVLLLLLLLRLLLLLLLQHLEVRRRDPHQHARDFVRVLVVDGALLGGHVHVEHVGPRPARRLLARFVELCECVVGGGEAALEVLVALAHRLDLRQRHVHDDVELRFLVRLAAREEGFLEFGVFGVRDQPRTLPRRLPLVLGMGFFVFQLLLLLPVCLRGDVLLEEPLVPQLMDRMHVHGIELEDMMLHRAVTHCTHSWRNRLFLAPCCLERKEELGLGHA